MINRFWLKIQQIINNLFPRKRVQQHLARQVMAYWCEENILVHEVTRLKGLHPADSHAFEALRAQYRRQAQQHEYNLAHELPQETQSTVIKYM